MATQNLHPDQSSIELSPEIEILIKSLTKDDEVSDENDADSKIHVEMTTGKAAFFYEKIRNTIGYQEEQMLRRLAITRIISRRARFDKDEETIATGLIWELIQSGYLLNDSVPQQKVPALIDCLKKYSRIQHYFPTYWSEYFFGIMGSEIESLLIGSATDELVLNSFHALLLRQLFDNKKESSDYQKISDSLYYALAKHYLKLDKAALRYYALNHKIPGWSQITSDSAADYKDEISHVAKNIELNILALPDSNFQKIAKRYYPLFIILQDIAKNQPKKFADTMLSKQKLTLIINQITSQYFQKNMAKLSSSILKAVLFILSTKVVLAFIFEIPYDKFFHGSIHLQPLLINIIFPPLLMLASVFGITVPGAENSKKIVEMAKRFIYNQPLDDKEKQKYQYKMARSNTLQTLLNIFYSLTAILTIFGIAWLLKILGFNLASGCLFFFFLSAVSFLAFRIRRSATDLMVVSEKESAFVTIFDFLLLPFLKIGAWLSKKFEKANFLVLVFDFVLEAPFKTILETIEHWFSFMREKKDEIIS